MRFKKIVLRSLGIIGSFRISSYFTRNYLRILAYHGFSLNDEHLFRPMLFMRGSTFERRITSFKKRGYTFIPFEEALMRFQVGRLRHNEVVLTIDDGFFSVKAVAVPILKAYSIPATLYITTYYVEKQTPIFRLAIAYMVWRSRVSCLCLDGLMVDIGGYAKIDTLPGQQLLWNLILRAESNFTEEQRVEISQEIGRRLEVDYDDIVRSRSMSLLNRQEISELIDSGLDVQLHTHRHRLSVEEDQIMREITDNRNILETLCRKPLNDFCYPSGEWLPQHFSGLSRVGIRSAVTCDRGINRPGISLLQLMRILDSDDVTTADLFAEVSGLKYYLRRLIGLDVKRCSY